MAINMILILIYLLNCKWVATRWQQYSTHLHTNNTQNDTKQTIHRTTQKFLEKCVGLGSVTRSAAVTTVKSHRAITNKMCLHKTLVQLV